MAKTQKSELQLRREIQSARESYHEESIKDAPSKKKLADLHKKVKDLSAEQQEVFTRGAVDCRKCKSRPVGMHKSRGNYEIGCLNCNVRAREESLEETVEAWNAQKFYVPQN